MAYSGINIAISTFVLVFLRGIQQQNVIHGNYIFAAITPFAIAAAEVATILWISAGGWLSVLPVGIGGSLGIVTSMIIHRRYLSVKAPKDGVA